MLRLGSASIIYQIAKKFKRKSSVSSNTKELWLETFMGYSFRFQLRILKLINS